MTLARRLVLRRASASKDGDELGKLLLILWRMKAAIKRGASDASSQTSAKSFELGDQDFAVIRCQGHDSVMANEAHRILDHQAPCGRIESADWLCHV